MFLHRFTLAMIFVDYGLLTYIHWKTSVLFYPKDEARWIHLHTTILWKAL